MASATSVDLRASVVTAVEEGASRRQAAKRFGVSPTSAIRWYESFVQEGRGAPKPMGEDQRSQMTEAQADLIVTTYEAKPEIFLTSERRRLPSPTTIAEPRCRPYGVPRAPPAASI